MNPNWITALYVIGALVFSAGIQYGIQRSTANQQDARHKANSERMDGFAAKLDALSLELARAVAQDPGVNLRLDALERENNRLRDRFVEVATALAATKALLEERTRRT